MTQHGRVLFDACTLQNFAIVGRLDLLRAAYEGRCAWTDGTEREIQQGSRDHAWLQSLNGALWLQVITDEDAVQQIEKIRRMLGGSPMRPRQHLGEAQAIYHAASTEPTATFATDDRAAYDMATRRGVSVIDTPGILAACYQAKLVGCPEAYKLLQAMAASRRGVAVPPSHWHICPPRGH